MHRVDVTAVGNGPGSGDDRLREHLATQVALHHGEKKGRIEIEYYGADDLQRLLDLLGLPPDD